MATSVKPGTSIRVTITKHIRRDAARKTIERLFMKDKAIAGPIERRSRNFKALPKRRGGRIWTKYPNKVHAELKQGVVATLTATPQVLRDLASVEEFVSVK